MKGRVWILAGLAALLLLLPGVEWPRGAEIERYQSADVLAADRTGGMLTLTLSLRGDAEAEGEVCSGRGATLEEAVAHLSDASVKEPLYAQTRFLLLGEGITAEEAGPLGTALLEGLDLRLGTAVYGVDGEAASLMAPGLGDTLTESRYRLGEETVSTLGTLLRQYAAGETPELTRLGTGGSQDG